MRTFLKTFPTLTVSVLLLLSVQQEALSQTESSSTSSLEQKLAIAGDNRSELQTALDSIESEFKIGLQFLITNMPDSDAKSLDAKFLLDHVRGSYTAWQQSPWHDQISQPIFLNYILPYASVSEKREPWQNDFRKRFLPLVQNAKSPSEAAVILNQKIFPLLNVKYSTKRKRADQGPYESIEGGTASCTGLSILLIDACRSVGVPARFVGTPRWSDNSGNHSWVEIWDGDWKFTGAAEPTGDKLNAGWFVERASAADESKPMYSIYAVSFKKTGLKFPLVWQRDFDPVWSTNVTARYTKTAFKLADDEVLFRIRAIGSNGQRVRDVLTIRDQNGEVIFTGSTKDETFDANDHVNVVLKKNATYSGTLGSTETNRVILDFKTSETTPAAPLTIQLNADR